MNKYNFKRIFPQLLVFLGIVLLVVGFVFVFQGNFIGILFIVLCFVIEYVGILLAQKNKSEIEEANFKKKEAEKQKQIDKSLEIKKNNNLEEIKLNIDFKNKYGISFLELQEILMSKDKSIILLDITNGDEFRAYTFILLELNNTKYFLLDNGAYNSQKFVRLFRTATFDDELLEIYKNTTLSEVEECMYLYDDLEYVEYVNNVKEINMGSKPSSLSLSVHEELFGTAAAMKKLNNSVYTRKYDNSYIKFYFSSSSRITPKKYLLNDLEKRGEIYYKGTLAKIWAEKEKNHVLNDNILNASKTQNRVEVNNTSDDPYAKLRELKVLLDEGILTQEEFDAEKKKLLNN